MQLVYGGYYHDANSTYLQRVDNSFTESENGKQQLLRKEITVRCRLVGSSRVEIYAKLNALVAAYQYNGLDLVMYDDNGVQTPWFIDNSLAIGGVQVSKPVSHDEIKGSEGITYLNAYVSVRADYFWLADTTVLAFKETLSFRNNYGGPRRVWKIPATGPAIRQQVSEVSLYRVTQSGSITVQGGSVTPMDPVFDPLYLVADGNGANITYESPKMMRGVPVETSCSWQYEFESGVPLEALPRIRG